MLTRLRIYLDCVYFQKCVYILYYFELLLNASHARRNMGVATFTVAHVLCGIFFELTFLRHYFYKNVNKQLFYLIPLLGWGHPCDPSESSFLTHLGHCDRYSQGCPGIGFIPTSVMCHLYFEEFQICLVCVMD